MLLIRFENCTTRVDRLLSLLNCSVQLMAIVQPHKSMQNNGYVNNILYLLRKIETQYHTSLFNSNILYICMLLVLTEAFKQPMKQCHCRSLYEKVSPYINDFSSKRMNCFVIRCQLVGKDTSSLESMPFINRC